MSFTLRMTQKEYAQVRSSIAKSKLKNQTDFFLSLLSKKPIVVIDDFKPLLSELKRHGSNLNQVARRLNERAAPVDFREVKEVIEECWRCYQAILELEANIQNAVVQGKRSQGDTC